MAYRVTLQIESRLKFDDELIDHLFDAFTDSMPAPLGCFSSDMSAKVGDTTLEVIHELEESTTLDAAGSWTLVAFRDALRMLDETWGVDPTLFEITEQTISKREPPEED